MEEMIAHEKWLSNKLMMLIRNNIRAEVCIKSTIKARNETNKRMARNIVTH